MAKHAARIESAEQEAASVIGQIGPIIARERASRGLTIEELARRAGQSAGLLSQVERGIGNPSIATLANIARALSLPIGAFFAGPDREESEVVHPLTRKRLHLADRGLTYQLLVPDVHGALGMLYIELPANFSNEKSPFSHPGEEAVYVVEGSVRLTLAGQRYHMDVGDSIRIGSILPHWYATGDEEAVVITAMTPPSF
jgi:transcriptional regulator with XRE-family HTH domain